MGAQLDWNALEAVAAVLGIEDIEMLAHGLVEIREYFHRMAAAKQRSEELKRGR